MARKAAQGATKLAEEVYCVPVVGANVYFVGNAAAWVLVDAGWRGSAAPIRVAAGALFGPGSRAQAIVLTHAHPDHIGGAGALARGWKCPVYLSSSDLPLVSGDLYASRTDALDPLGRLLLPVMRLIPEERRISLNRSELADMVIPLPGDGSAPGLPGWRVIATPGHTPGHIVLTRPADRVVIAGDAVVTAPLGGMLVWRQGLSRPFWLTSWDPAAMSRSFAVVADLQPRILATGHGVPMKGDVAERLRAFAGRYSAGSSQRG